MNEIVRVTDVGFRRSSAARFALQLLDILKLSTLNMLSATVRKINCKLGLACSGYSYLANVRDIRLPDGGYIPKSRGVDLEKEFIPGTG